MANLLGAFALVDIASPGAEADYTGACTRDEIEPFGLSGIGATLY